MTNNDKWIKMLDIMKYPVSESIKDGELLENREINDNLIVVHLEFPQLLEYCVFDALTKALKEFIKNNFNKNSKIRISYKQKEYNSEYLEPYFTHITEALATVKPDILILLKYKKFYTSETITINIGSYEEERVVQGLLNVLNDKFLNIGINIKFKTSISDNLESIVETHEKEFTTLDTKNTAKRNEEYYNKLSNNEALSEQAEYDFYKKNSIIKIDIQDIPLTSLEVTEFEQINGSTKIATTGVIIKSDFREGKTKQNKPYCLFTGVMTNYKDSILIKKFLSDYENVESFKNDLCVGKNIKVLGKMEWDNFSRCVSVVASKITVLGLDSSRNRFDGAEIKRIELHAHTKMSVLDSILNVEEYVAQASRYGHKALAVTDHENCHVLPEFFKLAKEYGIKPIAGVEANFVDIDKVKIASSNEDIKLSTATFVIFDLETTGLSVSFDEIIEIGAVKVQGGMIIDTFSYFVKPKKPISDYIANFTEIYNDTVYDAPNIEYVLPLFKEFIKDSILVAHNASFDTGFIYHELKRLNLYEHGYPTIDTIMIARCIYAEQGLKTFNLKSCGKYLHCEIEQQHRAIHDAKTTNNIFQRMIGDILDLGINNYKDLNTLINKDTIYRYLIPNHLNIIVKNREGLKNFYKLISDTQTNHYYKSARLTLDVLNKYRDGLLIGSGCVNGDVFRAAYEKDDIELERVIQKYDYIEVQPLSCYTFLYEETCDPDGLENIKTTIKKIINTAKKYNKLVVATGDVHELIKEDGEFRKIYLSVNRPNGGGPHELDGKKDDLDCHFRSTSEMLDEFKFLNDDSLVYDIVVNNTNKINDEIEEYNLFPDQLFVPRDDFCSKYGVPSMKQAIIDLSDKTCHEMYGENIPQYVLDRKKKELDAIISHGYFSVYYISHLLVKNSNDHGYLVGSRGSVGSSFAATLLKITEVNALNPHYLCPNCHFSAFKFSNKEKEIYPQTNVPKRLIDILDSVNNGFDLPLENCPNCNTPMKRIGMNIAFETFLGFTGEKVPDIDLNFSGEYQPQAHLFVQEMFGKDYSYRAGTVSEVADKTAFAFVRDYYSKLNIEKRQAEMERLALFLTGSKRTTGQHPGGIVVVPDNIEIYDVTPVQYPPIKDMSEVDNQNWRTTHFDYHSFEDNLLKLDILGHDDPTLLKRLMDIVHENPDEFPFYDVDDLPIIDKNILSLFSSKDVLKIEGEDLNPLSSGTLGIPEFGTDFVRGMLETIKPSTYNDIIKVSGLSHGTNVWNGNAEDLIKHTNKDFPEVKFEDVIGCRDDIMIYLINHGVDAATAFKIMETVRKGKPLKDDQINAMKANMIPEWYLWTCNKIKYLFPKAHATAYVINACRIAWFKIYKPIYYYAVYFSVRAKGYDAEIFALGKNAIRNKINELRAKESQKDKDLTADEEALLKELPLALEMVLRGYSFKQIDLVKSDALNFIVSEDKKSIYLPFITVSSLGETVAKSIIEARNVHEFISKKDFEARTSINKTQYSKLCALGVLDNLPDDDPNTLF